jgi:hypothetical protein
MISHFKKQEKKISLLDTGEGPAMGPFGFLTSLGLPALRISIPEGLHRGTFFYTWMLKMDEYT